MRSWESSRTRRGTTTGATRVRSCARPCATTRWLLCRQVRAKRLSPRRCCTNFSSGARPGCASSPTTASGYAASMREPVMELRMLVVVAPEHHELLGGRGPALVRCCCGGDTSASPSAGMTATASTTTSAGDGQRRKGGAFDPVVAECASASKARRRPPHRLRAVLATPCRRRTTLLGSFEAWRPPLGYRSMGTASCRAFRRGSDSPVFFSCARVRTVCLSRLLAVKITSV